MKLTVKFHSLYTSFRAVVWVDSSKQMNEKMETCRHKSSTLTQVQRKCHTCKWRFAMLMKIAEVHFLKKEFSYQPSSCYQTSIIIHTKLTLKSSLACAPRLSFLFSAAIIVCMALIIKFCNSKVSTKSVFHTIPLSNN